MVKFQNLNDLKYRTLKNRTVFSRPYVHWSCKITKVCRDLCKTLTTLVISHKVKAGFQLYYTTKSFCFKFPCHFFVRFFYDVKKDVESKGQIILKGLFGILGFFQKNKLTISFLVVRKKRESSTLGPNIFWSLI